jgi:hypothetical protein
MYSLVIVMNRNSNLIYAKKLMSLSSITISLNDVIVFSMLRYWMCRRHSVSPALVGEIVSRTMFGMNPQRRRP